MAKKVSVLPHQYKFITSEAKHPLLCGGYGSGKTRAFIGRAVHELLRPVNRGQVGLLAEPTYPMIRDVLMGDLIQTLNDFGIRYVLHKSEYRISTAYGSVLLRSAENWERWRSLNLAWGGIDEVAQLRDAQAWNMLLSRLRSQGSRKAFASSTPEGFNFLYDLWGPGRADGYELIKAKTTDNPYLPADYVESLLQAYSPRMVDQYINGEFVVLEGRVYDEYTEANQDNWTYKEGLETFVAMDFGRNRPSILWGQIDDLGYVHWFHEIRCRGIITESQAIKMKEFSDSINATDITVYCDPAGAGMQSGSRYTDVQMLQNYGFDVVYTTARTLRSVSAGIDMTQGMFCNGAGERRMFVNAEACPDLHRSLQGYKYKPGNKSVVDKDGVNDHDCDAVRYFVINRFPPQMMAEWRAM